MGVRSSTLRQTEVVPAYLMLALAGWLTSKRYRRKPLAQIEPGVFICSPAQAAQRSSFELPDREGTNRVTETVDSSIPGESGTQ